MTLYFKRLLKLHKRLQDCDSTLNVDAGNMIPVTFITMHDSGNNILVYSAF